MKKSVSIILLLFTAFITFICVSAATPENEEIAPLPTPLWDSWITVTYEPNGGVGGISLEDIHLNPDFPSYTVGTPESANVSRLGYVFVTWNTKPDGSGINYPPEAPITRTTILYAIWVPDGSVGGITVMLNNQPLTFDQQPIMENDRILVPFRAIFEAFGADVEWYGEHQRVVALQNNMRVEMTINNPVVTVNGEEVTMDVSPKLVNSRTMVPLRFLSEEWGYNVEWNEGLNMAIIAGN